MREGSLLCSCCLLAKGMRQPPSSPSTGFFVLLYLTIHSVSNYYARGTFKLEKYELYSTPKRFYSEISVKKAMWIEFEILLSTKWGCGGRNMSIR